MSIRRSSIVCIALGVVLIVAAIIVRFVVVPSVSKLPTSLDITNVFTGTGTLLNAEAAKAGDMRNAVATDLPVEIIRHDYVTDSHGDTAILHDDLTVNAPHVSLPSNHTYAVDRKTMAESTDSGAAQVEPHKGLIVGLPIDPDPNGEYNLYDFATQSAYPMHKQDSATRAGRDVLDYAVSAQGPLKDKAVLDVLPPVLPKAQVAQMAAFLPPASGTAVTDALAPLPDLVPISYTADSDIRLAIDSELGTPLDGSLKIQVIANIGSPGQTVPLMPMMALDTKLDKKSADTAADTVSSTATKLSLVKIWIPLALLILGLVALAWGIIRRKPSTPARP
ncbi:hypothetical protein NONO_c50080 [Nocardia nova SH22a]|uniref:DUF3068 domain-containing protein n=1 Tax=Nocardia nova SH22a TaxID=1415166 RepID=W5TKL4_9NOCA|nr:DUF3068 domain-containing protein [Nocardia nova]AHH19792.1 hypothetical protein NONO_c50080 [Nocardia nova SH22a]